MVIVYFLKWNIEVMWYNEKRVGIEIRGIGVKFWFFMVELCYLG